MHNTIMYEQSLNTFNKLNKEFDTDIQLKNTLLATNPLGLEVEVKWRYYFPTLWDKYLASCSYKDLSKEEQQNLTQECNALEQHLLPKLEKTVSCGIPKGLDKYYEFAFTPCCNIELITGQIDLLKEQQLIPEGLHSLHITVGNMKIDKNAYYLLLLLELITLEPQRIMEGFHKEHKNLSSAWARKGLGGLFQKESDDLQYGSTSAVEFRTLQINEKTDIYELLSLTSYVSDIIINEQKNGIKHALWSSFIEDSQEVLLKYDLADKNWKKPNLSPEYWQLYINHFDSLKAEIPQLFKEYFPQFSDFLSNKQKKIKNTY
jgi:hypothetical protein